MPSPQAIVFHNGRPITAEQAAVSIFDLGFTMGVCVTEQIRTYGRETPLLDQHLDRFFGGLKLTGIRLDCNRTELESQISAIVAANGKPIDREDELGIGICATPGLAPSFREFSDTGGDIDQGPTLLVYTYRLAQQTLMQHRSAGIRLRSVGVQEIPAASIPKSLKCRSRMHYYLAEQQATAADPGCRALLNDGNGYVAEGTTASVIFVRDNTIVTPRDEMVLPSVTLKFALELAASVGIEIDRRDTTVKEFETADEVLWLSTPVGILPVTQVNGHAIDGGIDGPITTKLISAWDDHL